MNVNDPNNYSREERYRWSWRGSRGVKRFTDTSALRQARRITLIDLLLLAVITAVLVPWAVQRNKIHELGDYRAQLERSESGLKSVVLLTISLPGKARVQNAETVGWRILDSKGNLIHQEYDIPPESGKSREFIASLDSRMPYMCILIAGVDEKTVELPPVAPGVDGG